MDEKRLESGSFLLKPERQPKDFDFRQGTDLSEQESNLREKTAAESGWKQDVSNRPLRTSAKAVLSRSDLGGVPTERRS